MVDVLDGGDVVVVGGGVIGLSVAWKLADAGFSVTMVNPRGVMGGASWDAAGMLAPVTEAWPGEDDVLALGTTSLAMWPEFAARLAVAGPDPGLRTEGTLALALDSADAANLDTLADYLASSGRAVERLTGRQVRALEPTVGPRVRSGLLVPGDLSVDNRLLLRALENAALDVDVRPVGERVTAVRPGEVELDDGRVLRCTSVVIAAGAWSGQLHPALADLVRPVKGEILRLAPRSAALPPPTRTLRAHVESRPVYLVPRAHGEVVLGATQYDVGFDTDLTVAGMRDLLADAEQVLPGIGEYKITSCVAALRAGSRDNLPLIGWLEPGIAVATGHHRNGLLMAPATAEAVVALLAGDAVPDYARPADPARFQGSPQ